MNNVVSDGCGRAVGVVFIGWSLSACATMASSSQPATTNTSTYVGEERAANDTPSQPAAAQPTTPATNPLLDERVPDESHALPELRFRHLGMHIGGGSNTPQSKEPFLNAISEQEEALLSCYRLINDAGKNGSFGLDLYISRSGGAPEIRSIRQKIGDETFVHCMSDAFLNVRFGPTERPTMVSYSLLFEILNGPS